VFCRPEYEDEEQQQSEEHRHVVHRSQHNDQLVLERRQETHQLQYSQKSERAQYREAVSTALNELDETACIQKTHATIDV